MPTILSKLYCLVFLQVRVVVMGAARKLELVSRCKSVHFHHIQVDRSRVAGNDFVLIATKQIYYNVSLLTHYGCK